MTEENISDKLIGKIIEALYSGQYDAMTVKELRTKITRDFQEGKHDPVERL